MHKQSGDLGRRIAEQRALMGLTRAEVAKKAGMTETYLLYLETSPVPHPGEGDLIRLAAVLGTTSGALGGAGLHLPPGQRRAAPDPVLEELGAAECLAYLRPGGVGRFLYVASRGPVAAPVNYRMLGDAVIFRTGIASGIAGAIGQSSVSFDVDHLDPVLAEGWSVLVSGTARVVSDQRELDEVTTLRIEPWAGGERDAYIRLTTREITGRRIRAVRQTTWPPAEDTKPAPD
jgi:hypothetical protein